MHIPKLLDIILWFIKYAIQVLICQFLDGPVYFQKFRKIKMPQNGKFQILFTFRTISRTFFYILVINLEARLEGYPGIQKFHCIS